MHVLIVGNGKMGTVLYNELVSESYSVSIIPDMSHFLGGTFDVVIDFSHPDGINDISNFCMRQKLPAVIATTGYSDEQIDTIKNLSQKVPVIFSGNYSLGVILMKRLVRETARVLGAEFDIEIVDKHHHQKIDAPSGTAKMLIQAANEQLNHRVIYGRSGNQPRTEKEIAVHTIRGGSIVGEHEVIFAGADEILSIKHEALSKVIFAKGAIKAARWIVNQKPGLYNMEDLLFGGND